MLDVQAVYVRDIAELRGIRYVSMLRVNALPDTAVASGYGSVADTMFTTVSRVTVNGFAAHYIKEGLTTLLIALPSELMESGTPLRSVTNITVYRAGVDADGVEVEAPEVITDLGGAGGSVDHKAPAGSRRVTIDGGILHITGKKFDKAVAVRVNRSNQGYTVIDSHTILCTIPDKATAIEDVEVITTAKKINRHSLFAYLLTDNVNLITAEAKLVQQFIKVLLTTTGSDKFAPTIGGNLQNWVNQNATSANSQALVAKTVLNVINTAAKFSARQGLSNVPPEERLSDVQVLNVGFDGDDPTVIDLSLRLNTFARRQATISLMLGTAAEGISSAAEQAPVL